MTTLRDDRWIQVYRGACEGNVYIAPLPESERFPRVRRPAGHLEMDGEVVTEFWVPPYIAVSWQVAPGRIEAFLSDGSARRARDDNGDPIYADGDNVPEEWREPIVNAITEAQKLWPDETIHLRPEVVI